MTAQHVASHCKLILSEYGWSDTLVSDNGPHYTAEVFSNLMQEYSVNHITSSPHYPHFNGLAEKFVHIVKILFYKAKEEETDLPTYKVRLISEGEKSTFQYAKWCMETSHMCLTVLGIYRPPSGSATEFLREFTECLPKNALLDTNPIIMGDFNLHVNNENDDDSMNFLEMMSALGLKQNVMFDTHKLGNTLDLIFTETDSKITVKAVYKGEQLSDHSIVHMVLSLWKDKYGKCVIQFSDLINLNYEELADDINI